MTDFIYPINPKARAKMAGIVNKVIFEAAQETGSVLCQIALSDCFGEAPSLFWLPAPQTELNPV